MHTHIPQLMQSKLEHKFNAVLCVKVERTKVLYQKDTYLFPRAATQSLWLRGHCRRTNHLNNDNQKQATKEINKK
jgi:hypothetical protein